MAASSDLIDFNVIESHKENIQALPSGRSAKALAQLYSPPLLGANPSPSATNDANSKARAEFERELATIDEADDPLDVYDRYVKWTLDAYPSAQATPQSQLLPLLERATKAFQSSSHYKNDPRYLKLWLHYIRLFSDAPRETFVFLARQGIGEGLALYYEEYAAWLENASRWNQAREIYQMGIEREARPTERLLRKFTEFERRNEARPQDDVEPTSPALPTIRPALAVKLDPFASASPTSAQEQNPASGPKKSKSSKMAIFSDGDAPSRPDSGSSSKEWDNIGSLSERRKENSIEAKPWVGEKLKGGKTNGGMPKMMVFKDESSHRASIPRHLSNQTNSSNHEAQCVFNPKTGRLDCVFVNLEAVYPEVGNLSVEYCFEELRAKHRGWSGRNWRKEKVTQRVETPSSHSIDAHPTLLDESMDLQQSTHTKKQADEDDEQQRSKPLERGFEIFEDKQFETNSEKSAVNEQVLVETFSKTLALNDSDVENKPPAGEEIDLAKKARREERANRTRKIKVMDVKHIKNETKTIQLNMDSPTGPKIKRKKATDRAEPTMTINTKEAMDEIYGIFSQPLASQVEQPDDEEEDESENDDDDDDYTSGEDSTATGKLSAPASEYGDETRNELLSGSRPPVDDRTENTGWSEFTTSKYVPKEQDDLLDSTQSTSLDVHGNSESKGAIDENLMTPVDDENPYTRYVPQPPEDYEPPAVHVRDPNVIPNHRLPFMTPIVERTESSLAVSTDRSKKDYFNSKTPSRNTGMPDTMDDDDDPCSSPFQDVTADIDEEKRKILQPIRTKSTKGTIALGQGSAKSQIAAKNQDIAMPDVVQKGPIIKDAQCNPMDPQIRDIILSQMKPPLASFSGYHEHPDTAFGRSAEIKRYFRRMYKSNKSIGIVDKAIPTPTSPPVVDLPGADGTYTFKRELGAGTFAPVYLVENASAMSLDGEEGDEEDRPSSCAGKSAYRKALEAIKMEEPPSTWEFYILRQSHRRLGVSRAVESIVRAHEMHLFRDECFLVEEYRDQGTLLDLVNIARLESGSGGGMDEALAMWFTVELLRTVETLHAKQLIHGDLKGDNVLVRFDDPGAETDWSPTYFPNGAHGWSSKGVCLIDFGRGIDMKQFVPSVGFIADWKTTEADCAEMRELRPWTYQIDYHGLAGIVHSMLFGKYMETIGDKGSSSSLGHGATKTYRIRETLKRYWQTDLWADIFHLLLNPLAHVEAEEGQKMPVLKGMKTCRERMETWLEENCERGVGLKGSIAKMESAFRERRRKTAKSGQ